MPRGAASELVEIDLRASPLMVSPAAGVTFAGLAYNGSIPGPVLRARQGQRMRVRFRNDAGLPASVHWHGLLLPNDMDGVAGVTQPAVGDGGEYSYEFSAQPAGTRWYHDHAFGYASARGLYGMFVIEDPRDEPFDKEFALVFHDLPHWPSLEAAARGVSNAPMTEPPGAREATAGMTMTMGDEVAYAAHLVNGGAYPKAAKFAVRVGERVRLRILNASPTQTRYVRLSGHQLLVTHADGNALSQAVAVDALPIGTGERYDAIFEVREPGAFLLQSIASEPLSAQQAVTFYTEGMERAAPLREPPTLEGLRVFSYVLAGGESGVTKSPSPPKYDFELGGGGYGVPRWTIDGKVWPHTPKLRVSRGENVGVRFRDTSDMDHPMHLHGHVFALTEVNGTLLERPLLKDVALVPANGGSTTWRFTADSPAGRWLLHCHNEIHMVDGMMMEVLYED